MLDDERCRSCVFHQVSPYADYEEHDARHVCLMLHDTAFDPEEDRDLPPCAFRIEGRPLLKYTDEMPEAQVDAAKDPFLFDIARQHRVALGHHYYASEIDRAALRVQVLNGHFLSSMHEKLRCASHRPKGFLEAAVQVEEDARDAEEAEEALRRARDAVPVPSVLMTALAQAIQKKRAQG